MRAGGIWTHAFKIANNGEVIVESLKRAGFKKDFIVLCACYIPVRQQGVTVGPPGGSNTILSAWCAHALLRAGKACMTNDVRGKRYPLIFTRDGLPRPDADDMAMEPSISKRTTISGFLST